MTDPMLTTNDEARILDICRTHKLEAVHLERLIAGYETQLRKVQGLRETMLEQGAKLARVETALREAEARLSAEASMRPSLEVLQRMANGIDQFDRGRFQCAVAALPHETPKLSATVGITGQLGGIGDQLDRARQRRLETTTLRVITDG